MKSDMDETPNREGQRGNESCSKGDSSCALPFLNANGDAKDVYPEGVVVEYVDHDDVDATEVVNVDDAVLKAASSGCCAPYWISPATRDASVF